MPTGRTTPPPLPRPPAVKRSLVRRAVLGLAAILVMAGGGAWLMHVSIDPTEERASQATDAGRVALLADVKSWGYQLQGLELAPAARSAFDLLVVDETLDGAHRPERRAEVLKALKQKPDGQRRLVLAYLSIGEAEDYRPYWSKSWVAAGRPLAPAATREARPLELPSLGGNSAHANPLQAPISVAAGALPKPLRQPTSAAPPWLGDENPDWRGNYRVRFWEQGWQALMFGGGDAALDRLMAKGFDGVYLDRADVYQHWLKERPAARTEMIELIRRISERARQSSPGFIVALQNAEELLSSNQVRKAIDLVAKEDWLHGIDGTERANSETDVAESLKLLKKAQKNGLPVLVVEYLSEPAAITSARRRIEAQGFVPYFAPRALNQLRQAN